MRKSALMHLALLLPGFLMLAPLSGLGAEGTVIKVLQDFEAKDSARSTPGSAIKVEISKQTDFGKSCLQVTIPKGFNWRWKGWNGTQDMPLNNAFLATLSGPYLPPETDAVRMKVKVASGRAIIAVGGPVNQIGNSDVYCDPQLIEAGKDKGWQTIEISLNQRLMRNYRRPNFTVDLPVVYYTRWAQEPFYLYLLALPEKLRPTEETVVYIDQVELIARGEGKPFPKLDGSIGKDVAMIADFDSEKDLAQVSSVGHGYSIIKPFEFGYRRQADPNARPLPDHIKKSSPFIQEEGTHYPAPRFSLIKGKSGGKALQAECLWAEEGQITTVKTLGDAKANAFRLTLKPDYRLMQPIYNFKVNGKAANVVDFIVFVSPKGSDFPWGDIEATDELKKAFKDSGYRGPGAKYDYLLTMDRNPCVKAGDIRKAGSFGFYFARRYVAAGEWSTVTIPFADFVCVYGQGACKDMQSRQQMLSPKNIAAIGVLAPYGSGHGTIGIDNIGYVAVPGTPAELRSFWQVPEVDKVKLVKLPNFSQYGVPVLMTLGEDAPQYLK
jgi:hypothetical protein